MSAGVRTWASPEWRATATAWLDDRLAAAGIERTGPVEQPRVRPWSTVLRAPTTAGVVWLKAAGPETAAEVPLYAILARESPGDVLRPIASDPARGWILLPDGGPTLVGRPRELSAALVAYGRLQRRLMSHVGELLAAGVRDMRPAVMPERFEEALAAAAGAAIDAPDRSTLRAVAALRPAVADWCERLAASPVPASLDHNDLHGANVLASGGATRFYDWGDAVVAHPFAVALVPRQVADPDLDGYLAVFADLAPRAELLETLALACRVGAIARTLTWERALRSARERDEPVDPAWARAPFDTLASLLDDRAAG